MKFLPKISIGSQTITILLWLGILSIIAFATGVHTTVITYFTESRADAIIRLMLTGLGVYFMTIINAMISNLLGNHLTPRKIARRKQEEYLNNKFLHFKEEAAKVILMKIKSSLNKEMPSIKHLKSLVRNKYQELYGRNSNSHKSEEQLLKLVLEKSDELLLLGFRDNDVLDLADINSKDEKERIQVLIPNLLDKLDNG